MVDDTRRQPRSPESVQSVDWAVDLLEALAGFEGPVGVWAAISLSGPAERFNVGREPGLVEAMGRVAQRFADELLGP
jgi:hypothetical protein